MFAQDCPDGLGSKFHDVSSIGSQLGLADEELIEETLCELAALGLVRLHHAIGRRPYASLTQEFYAQLDHQVMGWNTIDDAVQIACFMLDFDTGNAPVLHEKTGWTKRRFNPAFAMLLNLFADGVVSRSMQPDYPSRGVLLTPEGRVALRRFIRKHSKDR